MSPPRKDPISPPHSGPSLIKLGRCGRRRLDPRYTQALSSFRKCLEFRSCRRRGDVTPCVEHTCTSSQVSPFARKVAKMPPSLPNGPRDVSPVWLSPCCRDASDCLAASCVSLRIVSSREERSRVPSLKTCTDTISPPSLECLPLRRFSFTHEGSPTDRKSGSLESNAIPHRECSSRMSRLSTL